MYKNWDAESINAAGDLMRVHGPCRLCGEIVTINNVPLRSIESYINGALVQRAFPMLDDDQREFFVSGTCGSCWDKMFPPEEDDVEPMEHDPNDPDDEFVNLLVALGFDVVVLDENTDLDKLFGIDPDKAN
jgi:hypothetical protein